MAVLSACPQPPQSSGGGGGFGAGGGGFGAGGGGSGAGGGGSGAGGGQVLQAPPPNVTLTGTEVTYDAFKVVVPSTLVTKSYSNAMAFDRPGDECRIALWPPVAFTGDLDAQALQILKDTFPGYGGILGVTQPSPLDDPEHLRGVSGEGWQYVELQGQLLDAKGWAGTGEHVRILLARLGDKVAAMTGWEASYYKNNRAPNCVYGEILDLYEWTPMVYSLSFPNYQAPNPQALRDELVGAWFGTTSGQYVSLVWKDVFSGNGRHSDLIGSQTWQTLNPNEILSTFSTWQGNGSWAVNRNLLTVWPDDSSESPSTRYFRIFQEVNTSEPTGWRTSIRKLGRCGDDQHYCEGWASKS